MSEIMDAARAFSSMHLQSAPDNIQPRLPPELEQLIFTLAARDDENRRTALPALMLVARRVQIWLQPLLYEIVALPVRWQSAAVPLPYPLPARNQMHHIKHFLMVIDAEFTEDTGQDESGDDATDNDGRSWLRMIPECYNIQNLAIWCHPRTNTLDNIMTMIHSPHRTVSPPGSGLLRLSVSLVELFPDGQIDFNHIVLKDLTHLEVFRGTDNYKWQEGNNYGCLKNLQYLAFYSPSGSNPDFMRTVEGCMTEGKGLKVLLISGVYDPESFREDSLLDVNRDMSRIVLHADIDTTFEVEEWTKGALGRSNIWERAEKLVEEGRRNGNQKSSILEE